ncbi:MAG: hypothetical protein A2070_07685 [Bdellovibrionales bacterium GWC1_52_8]|nr:MAG: hypothetical protein A2Z97_16015 [Bdellovibrionales bacterium GWB1_52_6]OFZ03131.1 MAG: hypothetical protein A2X97_09495 [Bdellovibrionales bacterium GWA1_52_35]OFZ43305.1 MAG: hypothetical protein A2070_07685 [Bdellovibrionales bacterium GWC1_52_8]HCM40391.1 peroxidase [Bdellovibrionales bacterium]
MNHQPGILADVPRTARFVVAGFKPKQPPKQQKEDALAALKLLSTLELPKGAVIGLGQPLISAAKIQIEGLRPFTALRTPMIAYPSTQGALWTYFPGEDPGETLLSARNFFAALGPDFQIEEDVLAYKYAEGRDLSGYEDGTENPKDEKALAAAIVAGAGNDPSGMAGSSFVAAQRWVHDLKKMDKMSQEERDHVIGRDRVTNEELADAPVSAHVKRAAQESYTPPAFMLRRSMPWGNVKAHGLYFVAFGASLDPFEQVLRRMAGLEDGIPDALARFTAPVSGGYYWCPPMKDGRLNLRVLDL